MYIHIYMGYFQHWTLILFIKRVFINSLYQKFNLNLNFY